MIKDFTADSLDIQIYGSRKEMGMAAAAHGGSILKKLLEEKEKVNVMFAAAPSQNELLASLIQTEGIDWTRVSAFHMDEYIGLDPGHPAGFRRFLQAHIFSLLPFGEIHLLNGNAPSPEDEARRYSRLLEKHPLDVCFMGIGENGHLAFNDPPADFSDPAPVKIVTLDEACRLQQVHDGCFSHVSLVPTQALTVTIPGLMSASHVICVVPGSAKAPAVSAALSGPIWEQCPASVLRTHKHARMYLDSDSGKHFL